MKYTITVNAGGDTKWQYIHAAAKRKARKLFARRTGEITYEGIDHDKTVDLSWEPNRCLFFCVFDI